MIPNEFTQLYSTTDLQEYCKKCRVETLDSRDYQTIIVSLSELDMNLYVANDSQDSRIYLRKNKPKILIEKDSNVAEFELFNLIDEGYSDYIGDLEELGYSREDMTCSYEVEDEDAPEEPYYIFTNIVDVLSHMIDETKLDIYNAFVLKGVGRVYNFDLLWEECQREYTRHFDLCAVRNRAEAAIQPKTYHLKLVEEKDCGGRNKEYEFKYNYHRASELNEIVYGFLLGNQNSDMIVTVTNQGSERTYNLEEERDFREFVFLLDSFDTVHFNAWNKDIRGHHSLYLEATNKTAQELYILTSTFVGLSRDEEFPTVKTKVFNFVSYEAAVDGYNGLKYTYERTYGPESDYNLKDNELYIETEFREDENQCRLNKVFKIKIDNHPFYKNFQYKCLLQVHTVES